MPIEIKEPSRLAWTPANVGTADIIIEVTAGGPPAGPRIAGAPPATPKGTPINGAMISLNIPGQPSHGPTATANGIVTFTGVTLGTVNPGQNIALTASGTEPGGTALANVTRTIGRPPAAAEPAKAKKVKAEPYYVALTVQRAGHNSPLYNISIAVFDKPATDATRQPVRRALNLNIIEGCTAPRRQRTDAQGTYVFQANTHGHELTIMVAVQGGAEPAQTVLNPHQETTGVLTALFNFLFPPSSGGTTPPAGGGHGH